MPPSDLTTFDTTGSVVFSVNRETRTIRGVVVPFGVIGENGDGKFLFTADTNFTWPENVSRVKLNLNHDRLNPVGHAVELTKTKQGIEGAFKVARGEAGDRALSLAEDQVYDGFSMGLGRGATFTGHGDVATGLDAPIAEVSLTPIPAFDDARVTSVAASQTAKTGKEPAMGDENQNEAAPKEFDLTPIFAKIEETITAKFAALQQTFPPREKVGSGVAVREELPYRFDGIKAGHCFMDDIVAAKHGAGEAAKRLDVFLATVFANEQNPTDVAALNPVQNRPELYVPGLHYARPLWNLVTQGGLDSITAFTIPKFKQVTGTKPGNHTAGSEPGNMKIEAEVQTVTPTAQSGLAIIRREVVDQGGNPNVDQIIWNEMLAGYFEGMETTLATLLGTGTGTAINISGGATDAAKIKLLQAAISRFQFIKGGDRFANFTADPTLYEMVSTAQDGNNRPLFPIIGSTNSDGSKRASLESVQIGNKTITPAWALNTGAAATDKSYLFVPESVYGWLSAPKRLDIEYEVANVRIGLWGYKASACVRNTDIIPVQTAA